MTCINRSDVALQYLAQLRRNELAASRATLSQYGSLLGPGFTKEMILLDLRSHLVGFRPDFLPLLSVQLSEAAIQNWLRTANIPILIGPLLNLTAPVEWCPPIVRTTIPVTTLLTRGATPYLGVWAVAAVGALVAVAYFTKS